MPRDYNRADATEAIEYRQHSTSKESSNSLVYDGYWSSLVVRCAGIFVGSGLKVANLGRELSSALGRVSRVAPVQMAPRNCTRDEGGPFGFGDRELIPSYRKLPWSKAMVVSVAEKSGR